MAEAILGSTLSSLSASTTILFDAVKVTLFFLTLFVFIRIRTSRFHPPYPPGPKTWPLIGNFLDIPAQKAWVEYAKWGRKYGDIIYLSVFGQKIVIINSRHIAIDLFEKRSRIYSGRPFIPMIEMMGWDFNAGFLPYGDLWRQHRRVFQQVFKKGSIREFHPIQTQKVRGMLRELLLQPENFVAHYQKMSVAIIMDCMYGHKVESKHDYFVRIADEAALAGSKNLFPGARLVNHIPILRHIPPWFPGASFHQVAAECHKLTDDMQNLPFDFVRKGMVEGTNKPSALSHLLERNDALGGSKAMEKIIKGVMATGYAGGADTTIASAGNFYLAMLCFPHVQKKAQDELDKVVGQDRLPDFSDRESLPYIEAVYRELMRWAPALPMAVPHSNIADDIFEGYFIPKGTIILTNTWAMTHNEEIYPDPHSFRPERYFSADGSLNDDSTVLAFGFGRRSCVGRHMASATVWIMIVSILAAFDIKPAKDADGNEVLVEPAWTDSAISHAEQFQCHITPRSSKAAALVRKYEELP